MFRENLRIVQGLQKKISADLENVGSTFIRVIPDIGVSNSYQEVANHWVDHGRFFTSVDEEMVPTRCGTSRWRCRFATGKTSIWQRNRCARSSGRVII